MPLTESNFLQTFSAEISSATTQRERDRIWQRVKTPIIEDLPDDSQHKLVTFLYRFPSEKEQTQSKIYLYSNLTGLPCSETGQLSTILNTDIGYLSLILPSELQTAYSFLKVDLNFSIEAQTDTSSQVSNYPKPIGQFAETQKILMQLFEEGRVETDPRNTNESIYYKDYDHPTEYFGKESILVLPTAPKLEGIPDSLETIRIERDQLKQMGRFIENSVQFSETSLKGLPGYRETAEDTRKYWIYLPPGYSQEAEQTYPLILFLDGSDYLNPIPAPSILNKLIGEDVIPPCIAVFLEYSPSDRMGEYNCHDPFSDFLANEFIKLLRQKNQLKIIEDPKLTTIVGLSASGLCAFYTALTHPNVFGNVIAQSPSLEMRQIEEIKKMIDEQAHQNQESQFLLEIGTYETIPIELEFQDGEIQKLSSFEASKKTYEHLTKRNIPVSRSEFVGGHDYVCWRVSLANHLKEIFDNRLKINKHCIPT